MFADLTRFPKTARALVLLAAAVVLLAVTALPATAQEESEDDKTLYALGFLMSQNLATFNLTEAEFEKVKAGLSDGVKGAEPKVDVQTYMQKVQAMAQARTEAAAEVERGASIEFVNKKAMEEGAKVTETGLVFRSITEGSGESPTVADTVTVHYHGTLRDGSVFDSSVDRGTPATFGLGQVVKCWQEGVAMMKVGGKAELTCPSDIAYGDRGRPPQILPGAALVFEVELISIGAPTS